jgi:hypothetical protein
VQAVLGPESKIHAGHVLKGVLVALVKMLLAYFASLCGMERWTHGLDLHGC